MDEYISRNELLKAVQSNVAEAHNERCAQILEAILNAPTADVVPKSELEISQHLLKDAWKRIEELDKLCGELQRKYDMAERKFADEEVIKALEWCIQNSECEYCEYREKTDKNDICPIRTDALNLINKQKTELEQLKRNLEQCENGYSQELHLARCQLADAKSEVESIITLNSQLEAQVFEQRKEIERLTINMNAYGLAVKRLAEERVEIFEKIEKIILDNTYPDFNREHKPVNIWKAKTGYDAFYELKKKYTEGDQ